MAGVLSGKVGEEGEKFVSEKLEEGREGEEIGSFCDKSSVSSGAISGIFGFTCPIAVKGFTRCLLTLIVLPFLTRSIVPFGNTFEIRYGPSHLSSIFSFVLRKRRLSRNTN